MPADWVDLKAINPIWFLALEFISKLHLGSLKILLPWGHLFLPPPPSPPLPHHYPTTTTCHLFTLGGLSMGMETEHKLKQFGKHKQDCWKKRLPFYTAPLADHNHCLNQWTHA